MLLTTAEYIPNGYIMYLVTGSPLPVTAVYCEHTHPHIPIHRHIGLKGANGTAERK